MRLRNHLYNIGYKKEFSFDVFTIGVGNLVMGGTGKTPMTEYLIRRFHSQFKMAVLSRGYGRRTSGFKISNEVDTAWSIGDEPLQIYRKFGRSVVVAVGENRLMSIPEILHRYPTVDFVVMDDSFQHRRVKPAVNLLLTNYSTPFYFDSVFPVGWLREPRAGARRADAIIVNKCPDSLEAQEMETFKRCIARFSKAPVFFSSLKYDEPIAFGSAHKIADTIVLVSALANNYLFGNYCATVFQVVKHFEFPDHHFYTPEEIDSIIQWAKERGASIVTTEKDMVKLVEGGQSIAQSPWFYLPINIVFLEREEEFHGIILDKANAMQSTKN